MFYSESKVTLIVEGILFIVLGILALSLPVATTLSLSLIVGILAVVSGFILFIRAFNTMAYTSIWLGIFNALLLVIVGCIFIFEPLTAVKTLTALLGIWFLVSGIAQITLGFQLRHRHGNWGTLLISGIASIGLSLIIWYGWPATTLWLLGVLVGVNFLLFGISLLALAFHLVRRP